MNLLDFFKKKEKRKRLEKIVSRRDVVLEPDEVEKKEERKNLGESKHAASTLLRPKITEKSSIMKEEGVYVFNVAYEASKKDIKMAVEELYKVKVDKVNVINMPPRLRSFGRKFGHSPGYRKALVRLSRGHKIEFT
ncbi:MAG: 50S ribosomal protein L23 [Candidatus Niyogibacteria bacterium]|nr:MAG: 50S ribosomal protein L23 [Candidatus Niyogibacteria bacterium]